MTGDVVAAVFDGPGRPFRYVLTTRPPLAPGEALVRVLLSTVCGSDLHTLAGHRAGQVPCVLGHEIVGVVEETNGVVSDANGVPLAPGSRVIWSVADSCGTCFYCRRDLPQKCESLRKYGKEAADPNRGPNGGFASHVHLWPGTAIVPIPPGVPDEVAAPAMCAGATAAACLRAAGPVGPGDTVVVVGLGLLGLSAAAMAGAAGATVIGVDANVDRQRLAERFGVTPGDDSFPERLKRATTGRGADVCLELSGSTDGALLAFGAARVGGTIVLAGAVSPTAAIAVEPERIVRSCLTIRGVHNYRPADVAAAIAFHDGPGRAYPFADAVARTFSLDRLDQAITYASTHRPLRVGIRPHAD